MNATAFNVFSALSPRGNTLAVIVRTYNAAVTTLCRRERRADFAWQRGYYEHVVRNQHSLGDIRRYIRDNPRRWDLDRYNRQFIGQLPRAF